MCLFNDAGWPIPKDFYGLAWTRQTLSRSVTEPLATPFLVISGDGIGVTGAEEAALDDGVELRAGPMVKGILTGHRILYET
jgi:hypothetical protein